MTEANAARVIRAPGRVVVSPTDLSIAYPYGGTPIGKTRLVVLQSLVENFRVESEGLGGETSNILEGANRYVLAFFLRGWDDDAIETLFADNYREGAVTGHAVFEAPGRILPGSSALSRARVVLFVPDDVDAAPAVLVYSAVPQMPGGAELKFQRTEELGAPVAQECVRNATGKIVEVGRLADLEL